MKLICIKENWKISPESKGVPAPFVGEKCTAVDSEVIKGGLYYILSGRFPNCVAYCAKYFALVSNIDEKEILQKRISKSDHSYNYE